MKNTILFSLLAVCAGQMYGAASSERVYTINALKNLETSLRGLLENVKNQPGKQFVKKLKFVGPHRYDIFVNFRSPGKVQHLYDGMTGLTYIESDYSDEAGFSAGNMMWAGIKLSDLNNQQKVDEYIKKAITIINGFVTPQAFGGRAELE